VEKVTMDLICIDDEYYDPYYILGVVVDDSDEHIGSAYRKKARRYHPDRAPKHKIKDYTRKFKIVKASYEYILKKRTDRVTRKIKTHFDPNDTSVTHRDNTYDITSVSCHDDVPDDVADTLVDPNRFGYGTQERIKSIEEYGDVDIKITNQFKHRKFNQKQFNRVFDYINSQDNDDNHDGNNCRDKGTVAIVHKTTDGFVGYNTADTNSCALVSSFRGLLVTGDDLGESGVGYDGQNYSDYKNSYSHRKNPDRLIRVPKDFSPTQKLPSVTENLKKQRGERQKSINYQKSISQSQKELYEISVRQLEEQEERDKAFILKYAKQYPEETLRLAMDGHLDATPNLLSALKQHHNTRFLN
jgi:hypothetical protein